MTSVVPHPATAGIVAAVRDALLPPSQAARAAAVRHQDALAKPPGALGVLEDLSVWLAGVQGTCPPVAPRRPRVVVLAGDHGVAHAGVSAYPPEVTAQMLRTFLTGGAAVDVLADSVGATVRVLDIAVDAEESDLPADVTAYKVRRGSGRIDREDALSAAEVERAVRAGMAVADEEADAGTDLLVPGDMGIGSTTVAAVLTGALTGAAAAAVTGRGTGLDDAAYGRKIDVVEIALDRARPVADDPLRLLATAGGADFAVMTGLLAQASVRRVPVVLDGVVSGAAALVAARIGGPGVVPWWLAGHRSVEPAHSLALGRLRLSPVLDLGLRLGEGTGGLLALPLLRAAAAVLAGMATLEGAGVSGPAGVGAG